jgi:competence protein ComEA
VDLIGEERGRLARAAGWLDASPAEAAGLAVLLVGALLVTAALVWGALGRPSLGEAGAGGGPPLAADAGEADTGAADAGAVGVDPADLAAGPGDDAGAAPAGEGAAASHDHDEPAAPAEVTVHVAGAVARPGVVTLLGGSRVADAIEQVGGLEPDADTARLNLARPLTDGEQIVVLREGEEAPPPPPGEPTGGAPASGEGAVGAGAGGGPVDLNTASLAELETLPGIGPALAQRIVTHREQQGPFREPGELRDVSGIGEKRFQDLADLVTVG